MRIVRSVCAAAAAIVLLLPSRTMIAETPKSAPTISAIAVPAPLSCIGSQVRLGGKCRSKQWIDDNLATTSPLLAFAACPTDAGCAIWFSELDSSDSPSSKSTVHFLANDSCTGTVNCIGGFAEIARLKFAYTFDTSGAPTGKVSITLLATAGVAGNKFAMSQKLGSFEWTESLSGYSYSVYDSRGNKIATGSALIQASGGDSSNWSAVSCQNTVKALAAAGGRAVGIWIGTTVIMTQATALATLAGSSGNFLGSAIVFNAGLVLAKSAEVIGGALGLTLGIYANEHDLCGELAKLIGHGPGTSLPPPDLPDPPELPTFLDECPNQTHVDYCEDTSNCWTEKQCTYVTMSPTDGADGAGTLSCVYIHKCGTKRCCAPN